MKILNFSQNLLTLKQLRNFSFYFKYVLLINNFFSKYFMDNFAIKKHIQDIQNINDDTFGFAILLL